MDTNDYNNLSVCGASMSGNMHLLEKKISLFLPSKLG